MNKLTLALAVLFAVVALSFSPSAQAMDPLHASCKLTWNFPSQNCTQTQNFFLNSIKEMDNTNCGEGDNLNQKCRYKLVSTQTNAMKATHTTPKKKYIDDLSFEFKDIDTGCKVEAFSTSEVWYAHLDFGTNYCNLRNLGDHSVGLGSVDFEEKVGSCTQQSSADCTKM
jgi:hypothetical protein